MKVIKLNNYKLNKEAIGEAVDILRAGGIVVHPTDTCYGLAADITNQKAVNKVYLFKKRNFNKPISIIVKNKKEFKKFGEWHRIIDTFFNDDNIYTFVVKKTKLIPRHFNSNFTNIGIQIPRNKVSLALLDRFRGPLTATSANISGLDNAYSVRDLLDQIGDDNALLDLIIDGGKLPRKKVSTIIEVLGNNYRVLRN